MGTKTMASIDASINSMLGLKSSGRLPQAKLTTKRELKRKSMNGKNK